MTLSEELMRDPAVQRWLAPAVERQLPTPRQTAAEIEAAREHAIAEGYAKGHREGRDAGYQEGLELGRKQIDAKLKELAKLMQGLAEPMATVDDGLREALSATVSTALRSLLAHELTVQPKHITAVVQRCIDDLTDQQGKVTVTAHPDDVEWLRQAVLAGELADPLLLEADPDLPRGSCRARCGFSELDANMDQRMQAALTALAEALSDDRGEAE